VVFVHGCFWHRHEGCRFATTPSTNIEFWRNKFEGTLARDIVVMEKLRADAWRVAVVWECGLEREATTTAGSIGKWLQSSRTELEIPGKTKQGRKTKR